jgi:predicted amidohydrolase YtcJ
VTPPPRVLFTNGLIHTPNDPGATALLVEGDRIGWIGHEGAALAQADGVDRVIDLAGRLVTPAFVDAHVHLTSTGMRLSGLDLVRCRSAVDVVAAVAEFCRDLPGGDIVLGHGWDETTWSDPTLPSREAIDRAAGGIAVYLTRVDVHSAIASTALLDRLTGVRDLAGYDGAGVLRTDAHHAARAVVLDSISDDQRRRLQDCALAACAAAGIAAVHELAGPDISTERDLVALLTGPAASGRSPRVSAYWGELGGAATAKRVGAVGAGGDLFVDGAIGSHTAWLSEPYADRPDTCGTGYVSWSDVRDHVLDCADVGVQAGFHVIGDAALDEVLRGFVAASEVIGPDVMRAGRHRLEHVEMPSESASATMAQLGLTLSVQPAFDALWGGGDGMYARRLGTGRAGAMNPFSDFQRAGMVLAFGSDSPVTAIDPWASVRAAMEHHTERYRISARSAFAAHTRGGWRAVGIDDGGILLPGMRASLAVWDVVELAVQAPDSRIAQWSTDPSSGTPVLPLLGDGVEAPACRLTMGDGVVLFDSDGVTDGAQEGPG